MNPKELNSLWLSITPVGSRATCVPAPQDTDEDYLVLVNNEQLEALASRLRLNRWNLDGSDIDDAINHTPERKRFRSYSKERINLIITQSPEFHRRFLAASSVAKRLNLLDKSDRLALFQAVLYGNPCSDKIQPIFDEAGVA